MEHLYTLSMLQEATAEVINQPLDQEWIACFCIWIKQKESVSMKRALSLMFPRYCNEISQTTAVWCNSPAVSIQVLEILLSTICKVQNDIIILKVVQIILSSAVVPNLATRGIRSK